MAIEQVAVRFVADIQQYAKNVQEAQKYVKTFASTNESAASKIAADLKRMAASYLGLAASVRVVQKIIKEGMDFNKFVETSTAAFGVMMKSTDAAKAKMQELYDWAVKSPLTFKETVSASKQLLAYGFSADKLVDTMETLGTVSKATGHSLDDIAYVYGTLKTQGKAYTRDLMQFAMRGIPIYDELAKVLGKPKEEIQKLTEAGKVGFREVEQAFKNMTTGEGVYAGFLQEYMKTFEGKMSMLTDVWQKATGAITSGIMSSLTPALDELTSALQNNMDVFSRWGAFLGDAVKAGIVFVRTVMTIIDSINEIKGVLIGAILAVVAVLKGGAIIAALTNPLVAIGLVVAGTVAGIIQLIQLIKTVRADSERFAMTSAMGMSLDELNKIAESEKRRRYKAPTMEQEAAAAKVKDEEWRKALKEFEKYKDEYDKWQAGRSEDAYAMIDYEYSKNVELLKEKLGAYPKLYNQAIEWITKIYQHERDQIGLTEAMKSKYGAYTSLISAGQAEIDKVLFPTMSMTDQIETALSKIGQTLAQEEDAYLEDLRVQLEGVLTGLKAVKSTSDAIATKADASAWAGIFGEINAPSTDMEKEIAAKRNQAQEYYDIVAKMSSISVQQRANYELQIYKWLMKEEKKIREIAKIKPSPTQMASLSGSKSSLVIGEREHDLEQARLDALQSEYDIRSKMLPLDQETALLAENTLKYAQAESTINDNYMRKQRDFQAEMWGMLHDLSNDEIGAINDRYDAEVAAAIDKYGKDVELAKNLDAYLRLLAAKRAKDLNLATYKNVIGGSSAIWEQLQAKAGDQFGAGNWMKGYATSALAGLQGTGVGKLVEGYMGRKEGAGGGEGMGTGLNVFMTALQAAGGVLSMVVKFIVDIVKQSKPMTDLLKAITTSVSGALMPVINSLAEGLSWLYDNVVVPVGNGILEMANMLIRGINNTFGKWFGFKINEFDMLKTTTEALQELADAAVSTEALTQTIDYLQEKLDDMVNSQIASLQDLYEVGAISAQEYEMQSKAIYAQYETEKSLVSVADQQLTALQDIYTRLMSLKDVQTAIENGNLSNPQIIDLLNSVNVGVLTSAVKLSEITGSTATDAALSAAISSKFHSLGGFASGTNYVPQNMPANIHKGEMIIPSDFSSAIRRGDLTLGSGSSSGGNINVTVNVAGSVKEEKDLAKSIATAIYEGQRSGNISVRLA